MAEVTDTRVVELMTGRKIDLMFPHVAHRPAGSLLQISHVTTADARVRDVSLDLSAGEIVGVAGLVGCGKSEIGRAVLALTRSNPDR